MAKQVENALKKAGEAHQGRAAEAARASISEIKPIAENAAETSRRVKKALTDQNQHQHDTFYALPQEGGKLPDGRPTQMTPPTKNWAEEHGLSDIPGFGWTSDYEEKQERFQATNDEAQRVITRYSAQTASNTQGAPQFDRPGDSGETGTARASYGTSAGEVMGGSSFGGSAAPAGTASAWAPSPSGTAVGGSVGSGAAGGAGTVGGGGYVPSGSGSGSTPPPAGTGSAWSHPPDTVRGPDGTLYRQGPDGTWQRQNPYNGRWAPAPHGPPGASGASGGGARGGAAVPRGGAGSGVGAGTGVGAGGRAGGFGPRGGELAPGGRAGVGSFGPQGGGNTSASGGAGAAAGRGGGMMRGAPVAGGQQQGGEDEEHERPSWLTETEDVFTNDMQRVAPPVIGATPYEQDT
ncbi:hypothetical protein CEP50_10255 [Actinopolyspora mortivallis]|uniref:PPE family domain-containing protein n=1 Tax=Actinopolyspora mortivallis TaxID=33906 RepID=A0A2T0GWJ2_ACTMO|nr:hypothetical protein CEP50_10255 [Actinopolyspora mortivallis]